MGKVAFLFAGQGAQAPGMGLSLFEAGGMAADVFSAADEVRPGTSQQCFAGSAEELKETINTQPCVFAVDLAAAMALEEAGVQPDGVAGFSLGELAALTYAGAFSHRKGFQLVCRRAELMQNANEENPGGMAAVLRMADEAVEELCGHFEEIYPVNYNSEGQLVVAGNKDELPAFCAAVKEAGGMAKLLPVGGGFHSPYMHSAASAFQQVLEESLMAEPLLPVYSNLSTSPYDLDAEQPRATLAAQMASPVLWKQTVLRMEKDGFDTFIEVGPGKTLSGLVKRILPEATIMNAQSREDVDAIVSALVGSRQRTEA